MRPLSSLLSRLGNVALTLGLVLSASACNTYEPGVPLPDILDEINATLAPNVLLLKPGDELTLTFEDENHQEKWGQEVRVGPDGVVSFKGLVDIPATGMSVDELDETLERLIEEDVVNNKAELKIKKLAAREVVFIGKKIKKRAVSVLPQLKVDFIETMARIQGEGDTFPLLESVVLIRWMEDEQRRRYWVIDAREQYWPNPELLYLQAGDIVYFPTHPIKAAGDWIRELTRLIPLPQIVQFTN